MLGEQSLSTLLRSKMIGYVDAGVTSLVDLDACRGWRMVIV